MVHQISIRPIRIANHNQTLIRPLKGSNLNHNQTVIRSTPGLVFNHNQTISRPASAAGIRILNHNQTIVRR